MSLAAARLGDPVSHGLGMMGMLAGALAGAAIGAAMVAATAATGGLALFAIVGGCIAGGGLAGGALARGVMTAMDLPDPTTGVIVGVGSVDVLVNGLSAVRALLDMAICNGLFGSNHPLLPTAFVAEGAKTVLVNGQPMGRVSMKLICGGVIKSGSSDVMVGGPTATVAPVIDTEAIFETALQVLGFAALGAGAAAAAVAGGAIALGKFTLVAGGLFVGFNKLHEWGESLAPGWGDILTGLAGFALLGVGLRAAQRQGAKVPAPKPEAEPTWEGEFWPEGSPPPPERTIQVNAENLRTTQPEYVTTPEYEQGAWKWSLYDSESKAKMCEIYSPTLGDAAVAKGGPELWLHSKQAQLPSGERVQVKLTDARWTDAALGKAVEAHTQQFGEPPTNLGGELAADNLGIFQKAYHAERLANPELTPQELADRAVLETPFAKTRVKLNYGDFRVSASEFGDASFGKDSMIDVPTKVLVEALPKPPASGSEGG